MVRSSVLTGKDQVSLPCSCCCKEEIDRYEEQCAQKNVTVHIEETGHGTVGEEPSAPIVMIQSSIVTEPESEGYDGSGPLSDQRSKGHTIHLHAQSEYKGQTGDDVHHVLSYRNEHGDARVLHPDEPSGKAIEAEHGRRTPYTYIIIGGDKGHNVGCRMDQTNREPTQGYLKDQKARCNQQADSNRTDQQTHHLGQVSTAQSLRRQTAGAHAKKAEHPVDHVEDHRPDGYGTDVGCIAHVSDNGQIYQSQQRYRDIGNDRRYGQMQYFPIA